MRILVGNLFECKQCACFLQILENGVVGFIVLKTGKLSCLFGLVALIVHGDQNLKLISYAGEIVVDTVAGRGVDAASTAVHGDIVGVYNNAVAVDERMIRRHIFKIAAGKGFHNLIRINAAIVHGLFGQCFGGDIVFAV